MRLKAFITLLSLLTPPLLHATPPVPTIMVGIHPNSDGNCDTDISTNASYCEANILARETEIGRKFAIDSQYGPFDFTSIPESEWTILNGRMPMYTWGHRIGANNCVYYLDIVNGVYDTQLTAQATYLTTLGPMIVRLMPEMDKTKNTCQFSVDPEIDPVTAGIEFQALWQHVYNIVHPIATQIKWDFSPGVDAFTTGGSSGTPSNLWMDFYPGDSYVDYIGSEIYNLSPTSVRSVVASPAFNNWYVEAITRNKDLMLSETGAINNDTIPISPQQKWFYSLSKNAASAYPKIKVVVEFDTNGAGGDFRLAGTGEAAFADMSNKIYFSKMP